MKQLSLVVAATFISCTLAAPALAQERTNASYGTEVSVVYSLLRDIGEFGKTGIVVDFGKQVKGPVSLVGEVAMNRFSSFDETYSQAGAGVRFGAVTSSKMRPFAQVMFGGQHNFGSTGMNIQPGVGVNMRIARRIDAKVQADFPIVKWHGDIYKQFRFSAGIGVPLGR